MRTLSDNRSADSRAYSASLQQAAAAVFGVKLIDGDQNRKPPPPREPSQQQG